MSSRVNMSSWGTRAASGEVVKQSTTAFNNALWSLACAFNATQKLVVGSMR